MSSSSVDGLEHMAWMKCWGSMSSLQAVACTTDELVIQEKRVGTCMEKVN